MASNAGLRMKIYQFFSVLLCIFPALVFASQTSPEHSADRVYNLAVLAFQDKSVTLTRWQPLADYLSEKIEKSRFELNAYHNEEMEQAVASGEVDFVFTQPSQYVLLTYRHQLSSPLASLLNKDGNAVTDHFGGVIFTQAGRDDISRLEDVKGKRVAGASLTGLGAYQMQAYELLQHGVRLPQDVDLMITGQPQRNAVEAVLAGEADVGFVRTGVFEALAERGLVDVSQLKLLNAQRLSNFPYVTSTRLYPEWAFAALPAVDSEVIRLVAAALLAIPREGELAQSMQIAGFTIAGDYRTIDSLMRELRLEPFDDFSLSAQDVVTWWFTQIVIGLVIFFITVIAVIGVLLQRQHQLRHERNRLEQALEKLRLLNQVVEQSPEAIVITDLQARISYINPAFEQTTCYILSEVEGKNPRILNSGQTPLQVFETMWETLKKGRVWRGELINKRKNGEVYPSQAIISPVKDKNGKTTHYLAIQRDISQRKQREQRIDELLYRDPITGLANRNRLIELMDKQLHHQENGNFALLLLNIARFKFINQLHGVDVGDAVLVAVAKRLENRLTPKDVVIARLAADEFAIFCMLDNLHDQTLEHLAESAMDLFHSPFKIKGEAFLFDVAIGVAPLKALTSPSRSSELINQVFNQAGLALKKVRNQGSKGFSLFNQRLLDDSLAKHQLQVELAKGIAQDELRLFVQPQVNQQRQLTGLECLVRWQHPQQGLLLPGRFIAMAEESDLILALGDWVLKRACFALAEIQQIKADIQMAVNISPRHFRQRDFVEQVRGCLAQANARPSGLMIEITESLFLDEMDEVLAKMTELKRLGVRFSIDDFGTGYSSLSYLQQLPVDELKIDRAFILGMARFGEERSLVPSIYAMAQQMQLRVIAEGIETEEQCSQLSRFSQLEMQGFLFAKPKAYQAWLIEWQKTKML
ncbi:EAL domain-containing protein [Thiomicrospira microaerophila]|uniref:EAL domain-containing protein n=1 Tax=Thiomicrospira microaerophila TaxID=406020 RepID=UPI00200BEB3C|nr:EAL domain-containing protein [Thiomicrospira microaerophila]UQB43153.1 EAL domain-containing protein [Thiomicrospira microaerophila]